MTMYRSTLAFTTVLAAAIWWLWFGVFFGLGPDETDHAVFTWKHDLQGKTILIGLGMIALGIINAVYYTLTRYRDLEESRIMQFVAGFSPPAVFFMYLLGSYALGFMADQKLDPIVGYSLAGAMYCLALLNAGSIYHGLKT